MQALDFEDIFGRTHPSRMKKPSKAALGLVEISFDFVEVSCHKLIACLFVNSTKQKTTTIFQDQFLHLAESKQHSHAHPLPRLARAPAHRKGNISYGYVLS